jgi:hemerythrin
MVKLGIKRLDRDHEMFVKSLESLLTMDSVVALRELPKLREKLSEHFAYEEKLMVQSDYPMRELHEACHEIYIENLEEMFDNPCEDNIRAVIKATEAHIAWQDRMLVKYLKEQE